MMTHFYERTAYRLSDGNVPACFVQLDEHFDKALGMLMPRGASTHVMVLAAESICARMAEVEMYAFLIEDARRRHRMDKEGDLKAAVLTRAFFVGYLGAARALLDACANALVLVHDLGLGREDRTFLSPFFWQVLVEHAPNVHRRYHTMRIFFNEIFRWCAETTDRIAPLELVYITFGQFSTRDTHMKVLDEPEADMNTLAYSHRTYNWTDPLQLHDRWKHNFLQLCERVCTEIEAATPIRE